MEIQKIEYELLKAGLSRKEIEVVATLLHSENIQAAASRLFVSHKTIKFHLTNIYRKLAVKNRAALTRKILVLFDRLPRLEEISTYQQQEERKKLQACKEAVKEQMSQPDKISEITLPIGAIKK